MALRLFELVANDSPMSKRIRLLGFASVDDLPTLYAGAEAMIYPSLFEGFGLPPIEAMACGVPVISSGSGSLEEVTGDACLRIDPLDTDTMVAAINRVVRHPAQRADLVRRGLAHAAQFSWERVAEHLLNSYRVVLNEVNKVATCENQI